MVNSMKKPSQLNEEIKNYQPDVVGFTSVSSQFSFVAELAAIVKKIFPKTNTRPH